MHAELLYPTYSNMHDALFAFYIVWLDIFF
jgi:hypothetical protein